LTLANFSSGLRGRAAGRHNDGHLTPGEFGGKRRQPIVFTFCPTIFDSHILAFDKSGLFQSLAEDTQTGLVYFRRGAGEKSDCRHRWLLRARRERPCK
jgi:hypothetical protein